MMREFLFYARILDFILKTFPLWNLKLKEGNVFYRILVTGKRGSAKTLSFVFSGQKQYASRDIKLQVDRSFCYSCSVTLVSDSVTPWAAAHHASLLSFTISRSLLKLMFTELVMPSNHLILCHPLFLLPSIFPSIRVRVGSLHQVANALELQLQHQPCQ